MVVPLHPISRVERIRRDPSGGEMIHITPPEQRSASPTPGGAQRAGTSLWTCLYTQTFAEGRFISSRSTENSSAFPESSRVQPRSQDNMPALF